MVLEVVGGPGRDESLARWKARRGPTVGGPCEQAPPPLSVRVASRRTDLGGPKARSEEAAVLRAAKRIRESVRRRPELQWPSGHYLWVEPGRNEVPPSAVRRTLFQGSREGYDARERWGAGRYPGPPRRRPGRPPRRRPGRPPGRPPGLAAWAGSLGALPGLLPGLTAPPGCDPPRRPPRRPPATLRARSEGPCCADVFFARAGPLIAQ